MNGCGKDLNLEFFEEGETLLDAGNSPVNGMHIITNIRSLMARLIIRMLVVERISGLKATTGKEAAND